MKNNYLTSLLFASFLSVGSLFAQETEQQIAFPGAEGWGRFATGGRMTDPAVGSNVYFVTNLQDYAANDTPIEGTLRWALTDGDDTPRTILFKVGGTITLKEKLRCPRKNVTIAGHSAPGGGICISGADIYIHSNNYIVRFLRFRAGDLVDSNYPSLDIENTADVIIDHCSFSWSMEENVTMYDNKRTTMQWCILSEPLYNSKHDKGERGYGSQWGGEFSSYYNNLLAHCARRAPRVNGARSKSASGHDFFVDTEIINNVIYNWGDKGAVHGGELEAVVEGAYSRTNLINNYYKPGPATNTFQERWFIDASHDIKNATGYGEWYIEGNMFEINEYKNDKNKGDHTGVNEDNWLYADTSNSKKAVNLRAGVANIDEIRLLEISASSNLNIVSAEQAYKNVTSFTGAGAWYPRLDEVDERILAEAAGLREPKDYGTIRVNYGTRYVGIINSQDDLKPEDASEDWSAWPDLSMKEGETLPVDTDGDGIPDEWEEANGLNKNDPSDEGAIAANGYSNLENYLNSLIEDFFPGDPTGINTYETLNSSLVTYYQGDNNRLIFNSEAIISELGIYSIAGMKVSSIPVNSNSGSIIAQDLSSGIYILVWVLEDGRKSTGKVIIR